MTRLFRIALLGILTLACAGSARAAATASPCLAAELIGTQGPEIFADGFESGDTGRWLDPVVPGYPVAVNVDLGVEIELDAQLAGEHVLELRWMLPGGGLYQSVAVPIAAGAEAGSTRRLPGYPFPVAVARIRPTPAERATVSGSGVVASGLPLAGTSIVDSALWGDWSLEIYFDGDEEACLPPLAFRLEP